MIEILSAVQFRQKLRISLFSILFPAPDNFFTAKAILSLMVQRRDGYESREHKKWDTCKVSHKHPLQKGGEEEKPKRTMTGGSRIEGNTPFIQISLKPND
jgi:hypothetical protein